MTRRSWVLAALLVAIVVTLVITIPTRRGEALAGAALVAFVGAFVILSDSVGRGVVHGSVVDAAVRRPLRKPARPTDLEKLERSLGWKVYDGAEFDARVRPLLEDLARHRGATNPESAALLDHGPRVVTTDLERVVTDIEALGPDGR